jgi:hypothetical protein
MTTTCLSCAMCERFSPTKRTLVERRCQINGAPRSAASRICYYFHSSDTPKTVIDTVVFYAQRRLSAGRPLYGFPSLPEPVRQGDTRRPTMPAELL